MKIEINERTLSVFSMYVFALSFFSGILFSMTSFAQLESIAVGAILVYSAFGFGKEYQKMKCRKDVKIEK